AIEVLRIAGLAMLMRRLAGRPGRRVRIAWIATMCALVIGLIMTLEGTVLSITGIQVPVPAWFVEEMAQAVCVVALAVSLGLAASRWLAAILAGITGF